MYSIAQHAVANGYGKIENLRAQATALSRRVRIAVSPSSAWSPLFAEICLIFAMRPSRPLFKPCSRKYQAPAERVNCHSGDGIRDHRGLKVRGGRRLSSNTAFSCDLACGKI